MPPRRGECTPTGLEWRSFGEAMTRPFLPQEALAVCDAGHTSWTMVTCFYPAETPANRANAVLHSASTVARIAGGVLWCKKAETIFISCRSCNSVVLNSASMDSREF